MKIAIDTNRYSDLVASDPQAMTVVTAADEVAVPFIVLAELAEGFRRGNRRAENERRLEKFLATPRVTTLYPDPVTVSVFADISAELRQHGQSIPTHDIWIAALVLQHGLTLYTRDRHFERIPQLLRI